MAEGLGLKKIAVIIILIVFAGVSFFWLSNVASDPESFDGTLNSLQEKETTVMALSAGTSAASCAISLIPGDGGTPIAEKLADMSFYFVIILSAIIVEKWLVTVAGYVAFKIILPLCAIALAIIIWSSKKREEDDYECKSNYTSIVTKIALFAVLTMSIVPASVILSDQIEANYQSSIQNTIEESQTASENIQNKVADKQDQNLIERALNKLEGGINGQIAKFKTILTNFVESVAVLLVTTCVIPILVFGVFIWLIKLFTGVEFKVPRLKRPRIN